jgi:hypothetical protein
MLGLLVVILILLWTYQGNIFFDLNFCRIELEKHIHLERSLMLNRGMKIIDNNIITGVARYGELCNHDNECKRPFTCFKKRSSSSGICRCPLKYNFVNNQCSK